MLLLLIHICPALVTALVTAALWPEDEAPTVRVDERLRLTLGENPL